MKKRALILGAVALAMAGLSGCGSSSSSSTSTTVAVSETVATEAAGEAKSEESAAAVSTDVSLPKNIEVQVPAKAGGGTDVMARALGQEVASETGSNVTIVNNTDGSGVVAMEKVRSAKGDGSTILEFHTTMLIKSATGIYGKTASDDFTIFAVSQGTEQGQYVLVTSADSEWDSLDKLITYAKDNELKVGIESGGTTHVLSGLFAKAADINVKYVEAGSDTEKLTALVGNTIDACIVNVNQAKQYVESDKANALAVITNGEDGAKSSVLPDVPSMQDCGVDFSFTTLNIFCGPKDMDESVAHALHDYYANAATTDAVNDVLEPAGMAMTFFDYDDGQQKVAEQQEAINSVVEELGLKKK